MTARDEAHPFGETPQATAGKQAVHDFWNTAACGEQGYAIGADEVAGLEAQAQARYRLEPYLRPFARFEDGRDKDVLEIGMGMGADHILRPGGTARLMIYHRWSLTGLMLWGRYGLLRDRPATSLNEIYSRNLEGPGTKAYTRAEAEVLCHRAGLTCEEVRIQLNHGDLLEGAVGQRHGGAILSLAKALWPRRVFRRCTPFLGLYLLISA